jgi:hypothetical protein
LTLLTLRESFAVHDTGDEWIAITPTAPSPGSTWIIEERAWQWFGPIIPGHPTCFRFESADSFS